MESPVNFLVLLLIPPAFSQFADTNAMKPDITFGDHNDRFDLPSLAHGRSRSEDPDLRFDDRRSFDSRPFHGLETGEMRTRDGIDFGFEDKIDSEEAADIENFEKELKASHKHRRRHKHANLVEQLHEQAALGPSRRTLPADAERELLLHYAVPLKMTVKGYLKPRLE